MTCQTLLTKAPLECMRMIPVSSPISPDELIYDLEIMINTELAHVNSWLKANKLVVLNVSKTEFMIIGSRQRLQTQAEVSIRAHIEGKEIKRVDSSKFLGLTMDETLS